MNATRHGLAGVVILAALLALGLPEGALAQKKKKSDEQTTPEEQKSQVIQDMTTAYRLIEVGRDKNHPAPEALVTAAGLFRKLARVQMEALAEKPTIEVSKDAPAGTQAVDEVDKAPDLDEEAELLFIEAQALGKQLKLDLAPLISQVKSRPTTRAPIGGPRQVHRHIGGNQAQSYHFKLESHRPTYMGFVASFPMRITVVRGDNDHVYTDHMAAVGQYVFANPGDAPRSHVPITIRIHNVSHQKGSYKFMLY